MVITFIFNSCSNIEYNNSKSDLEKMNLKGDICFIIEQKIDINNDQEIPVYEKTIKFNRYSKISYIKENNKETIFSYDENGILIVKKQTENILSMDNGEFIPVLIMKNIITIIIQHYHTRSMNILKMKVI